ncbi:MAG: KH domain-containing protein [Solirubrobacterales bacterium]|nr:KH domain-containing protein [Solirubrobacterales bacterium]
MRDLVELLVKALVSDPDQVRVTELDDGGDTVLEVRVADDDLGRVIGRDGRVANAIRTVAKAAATADDGGRVMVEIVEADRARPRAD